MRDRLCHPGAPRRGAAAVELAILLPLLVFLFVVAVDFSRAFYYGLTISNCARNGALYASDPVTATESPYRSVQEAALADASDLDPPPSVTGPTYGATPDGSRYVEVTVTYPFQTITSYPGVPSHMDLARTVRMRVVQPLPKLN
jgi:Flp pilus assembly protein TadG